MINAKAELSLRFNEMPLVENEGKKEIKIQFKTSLGTVICSVKSKSYRKALKTIENFDKWAGLISGNNLKTGGGAIHISGCGIQVFEKKEKDNKVKEESTKKEDNIHPPIKPKFKRRIHIPDGSIRTWHTKPEAELSGS